MRPIPTIILALALALTACAAPAAQPTPTPAPTMPEPAQPTAPQAPTQAPTQATNGGSAPSVTLDTSGVAQGITAETVAAVPGGADSPWWEAMPQYTLLTLQGYPISEHLMKPQIFLYPVKDLGVNETAGKVAESLKTLLETQKAGKDLPYLPLYNSAQAMQAQVSYVDFMNGKGVRYLTQYNQGPVPVNNHQLVYTYQGLTSDGQYYVSAVLPVNLSGLPADETLAADLPADYISTFPKYMTDTVAMLNQQSAGGYTPDLSKLDAMMQSIEVK